jgi:hypothetical protein
VHRFEKAGRRVAVVMRRRLRPLPERPPLRGLIVPIDPIFLRHFADRLRLSSSDFDQEAIRSASDRMKDILAKKNVTGTRAATAIAETLHLAASVNLAERRRDMARHRIDVGQRATDELCRRLDSFVAEVAELPPNSKHLLNQSVERPLACGFFDTDIFFSVLDAMSASLSAISPEVRALAARKALFDGDGVSREPSSQSSTKLLWEELDAETRRECEKAIEAKLPKSILLFRMLADALRIHAHSFAQGAPPSVLRDYARSVDLVWDKLGIIKGRRRFDPRANKSQPSAFAKFANEALVAVGTESHVSDRQIRQAIQERKRRIT